MEADNVATNVVLCETVEIVEAGDSPEFSAKHGVAGLLAIEGHILSVLSVIARFHGDFAGGLALSTVGDPSVAVVYFSPDAISRVGEGGALIPGMPGVEIGPGFASSTLGGKGFAVFGVVRGSRAVLDITYRVVRA